MSQYFPPYKNSSNNVKVELDLANYATKDDVKNITHVDVSSYATKTNLAALKSEMDKIDIDQLKTVSDNLAKLSNVFMSQELNLVQILIHWMIKLIKLIKKILI